MSLIRIHVIIVEDGAARRLTRSEGGLTRTARGVTCWRGHCSLSRPVLSSFLVTLLYLYLLILNYERINTGFVGCGRILLFYVLSYDNSDLYGRAVLRNRNFFRFRLLTGCGCGYGSDFATLREGANN